MTNALQRSREKPDEYIAQIFDAIRESQLASIRDNERQSKKALIQDMNEHARFESSKRDEIATEAINQTKEFWKQW